MPHKFNAARRHRIPKALYRVTNWAEYNEGLRCRGDVTIWVSADIAQAWSAEPRTSAGGQALYSEVAIQACLTLRSLFHLALRQTQGFMRSIIQLMKLDLPVPDFSTLSRRSSGLSRLSKASPAQAGAPITLIVDSTGLKIYGEGEWCETKHKSKRSQRSWRKLHIGFDPDNSEIVCADLTLDTVGDPTALPDLLDQLEVPVEGFIADGAYDGEPTSRLLMQRYGADVEIIIPPPKNAVLSVQASSCPTRRDRHILDIQSKGRMGWQKATGYNRRSRGETQIGRWKAVIGPKLMARKFDNQVTEVKISQAILNRMNELGKPLFERGA